MTQGIHNKIPTDSPLQDAHTTEHTTLQDNSLRHIINGIHTDTEAATAPIAQARAQGIAQENPQLIQHLNEHTQFAAQRLAEFNASVANLHVAQTDTAKAAGTAEHTAEHSIEVDQKTFDFLHLVRDYMETPLPPEQKTLQNLWDRLQNILHLEVDLPEDPRFDVIQEHILLAKLNLMDDILEHEHVDNLSTAVKSLENVDFNDFVGKLDAHVRIAWTNAHEVQNNPAIISLKQDLQEKVGELFLRFIPEDVRPENLSNEDMHTLADLKGLTARNMGAIYGLCMEHNIPVKDAITSLSMAAKGLLSMQQSVGKQHAEQYSIESLNAYMSALFDTSEKQVSYENKLQYVDAIFQHIYPSGQGFALELKRALMPPDSHVSQEGLLAQHKLTLAMQDLMREVNNTGLGANLKTRHNAIQHAIGMSSGRPSLMLTPQIVKNVTANKSQQMAFRLANIALLQMKAHYGNALLPTEDSKNSLQLQGEPTWKNYISWCTHLGLSREAENLQSQLLKELPGGEAQRQGNMITLEKAESFFLKGLEGGKDLERTNKKILEGAKPFRSTENPILAVHEPVVMAKQALRHATFAHLPEAQNRTIKNIQEDNSRSLSSSIKRHTQKTWAQHAPINIDPMNFDPMPVGMNAQVRASHYASAKIGQDQSDFLHIRAKIAQEKAQTAAHEAQRSSVSFFAPHLSRNRQAASLAIIQAHQALQDFKNDANDTTTLILRDSLAALEHLDHKSLKTVKGDTALGGYATAYLNAANPEDLQHVEDLLQAALPAAQTMRHYAPHDDLNPHSHSVASTVFRAAANSLKRRAHAMHNFASMTSRRLSKAIWSAMSYSYSNPRTQMTENLVRMALLRNFVDAKPEPPSAFKLTNAQSRQDVMDTLAQWGLDIQDPEVQYLAGRAMLDYTNPDSTLNIEKLSADSIDLAKEKLPEKAPKKQASQATTATWEHLQENTHIANQEGIGAMLHSLESKGGSYVLSDKKGFRFDTAAINIVKPSPMGISRVLPTNVKFEAMRDKSLAVSKMGDSYQVILKNKHGIDMHFSHTHGAGPAKAIAGVGASGQRASGIALTFRDAQSCEDFLKKITDTDNEQEVYTDVHKLDTLLGDAAEINFLNEKGASLSFMASFAYFGLSVPLGRSSYTYGLNATVSVNGRVEKSHHKNSQGEVASFKRQIAVTARAGGAESKGRTREIGEGHDITTAKSRGLLAVGGQVGINISQTFNVHTKNHSLSPRTNLEMEFPNSYLAVNYIIPKEVRTMIDADTSLALQFQTLQDPPPTSWRVRFALKKDILAKAEGLILEARSTLDPEKSEKLSAEVYALLADEKSYTPQSLIAIGVDNKAVSNKDMGLGPVLLLNSEAASRVTMRSMDLF